MKNINDIKRRLHDLKPYLSKEFGVSEIGVFGSYVRGEQTEKSDVDVLVDYTIEVSLLDIVRLENYLSGQLQVKVDLIPKTCVRRELKDVIFDEMVTV